MMMMMMNVDRHNLIHFWLLWLLLLGRGDKSMGGSGSGGGGCGCGRHILQVVQRLADVGRVEMHRRRIEFDLSNFPYCWCCWCCWSVALLQTLLTSSSRFSISIGHIDDRFDDDERLNTRCVYNLANNLVRLVVIIIVHRRLVVRLDDNTCLAGCRRLDDDLAARGDCSGVVERNGRLDLEQIDGRRE